MIWKEGKNRFGESSGVFDGQRPQVRNVVDLRNFDKRGNRRFGLDGKPLVRQARYGDREAIFLPVKKFYNLLSY